MSLTKMRRKMNKAIQPIMYLFAGIFVLSCFTWTWMNYRPTTSASEVTPVVARINGEELPRDLYERAVELAKRQVDMEAKLRAEQGQPVQVDLHTYHLARGRAFEQLVDGFTKAQEAEKEGIRVSDRDVRARIDRQIEDEMGAKMEGATPQEKQQYESQLRQLLDPQAMRRQMEMDELDKKLRDRFKPTEADLMASYNEVKTRHILIKTDHRSDAAARKMAEEIEAKLKAGGDFAKLAKQYSEDPGSKASGGELGWVTDQSGFVPEFTEAARRLKKGEISAPVKTMFGYHILQAEDVRTKIPKDVKDPKKKQEYMDSFTEKTIAARKQSFDTALRLAAKIEPVDPWVAGYIAENEAISEQNNGNIAESQKLTADAIKDYEQAAKGPMAGDPALEAKLAELYHATKQDDKALAHLNTLLANNSTPDLLMMKGEILDSKKQTAEAVKTYQEASKSIPPMQPWFHLQLQQAFLKDGRKDLAKKEYDFWTKFKQEDDKKRMTKIVPMPKAGQ